MQLHNQRRDTIHFIKNSPGTWFNGILSQDDITKLLTPMREKYNKKIEEKEAKLNEASKEKKVTNNGEPEPAEIDPEKFSVDEQKEFANDVETALAAVLVQKKVSTAYRWIVSVGYDYCQRFKPTKDDWVVHVEFLFLTISIIMVQGAHEIK